MSLKTDQMRSDTRIDQAVLRTIDRGSCNISSNPYRNQTRTQMSRKVGLLEAVRRNPTIQARFWSKVNKVKGDCWLWTASTTGTGYKYGQFTYRIDRKQQHPYAHRVAWELTHGESIADGLNACHRCDVPLCCNPAHLFLGSQKENLNDGRAKGRIDMSRPRTSKLTPAERMAIFESRGVSGVLLAAEYGVSAACISVIRSGRFSRPLASMAPRDSHQSVVSISGGVHGGVLQPPPDHASRGSVRQ